MQSDTTQNNSGPQTTANEDGTTSITLTKHDIALVLRSDGEKYWLYVYDKGDEDESFIRQLIHGAAALAAEEPEALFEAAFYHSLANLRKSTGSSHGPDLPATEEELAILRGQKYSEEELDLLTSEMKGRA